MASHPGWAWVEEVGTMTRSIDSQSIQGSLDFWQTIARNNGWEVRSLTIWQDRDGTIVDSVATREGTGTVFVKDWENDEVTHEFERWFDFTFDPDDDPTPDEDPTAPLENTEEGDVCVNHGGTFEGTYSDSLDDFNPEVDEADPICSEVDGGFTPYDQGCRFVPADSTDDARMNTPVEDREVDAEGRTEADWAAMGQDEFNRPEDPFENSPLHDATVASVEAREAPVVLEPGYTSDDLDRIERDLYFKQHGFEDASNPAPEEDEAEEARRLNEEENASPVPGQPVGWDGDVEEGRTGAPDDSQFTPPPFEASPAFYRPEDWDRFAQADVLAKAQHLQEDHGMTQAALLAQLDAGTTLTQIHDTLQS